MKKILLTGGCGFIGSYLLKTGIKKKYKILNVDKLSYASKKQNIKNKNYSFKKIDLCDKKKLAVAFKKFNPDIIINCAAESHVDRSIINPLIFFNSNLIGTVNLLELSIKSKKKIHFIQISTDEVFGSLKFNKSKFNENSKYLPNSPYSASKASADHAVRSFGETYKLHYNITNCSNNYGPYQYKEKLIPVIIRSCLFKENIPIYGKGINIRDWIFVQDHVDAIFKVIKFGKKNETYLIGSNNEFNNLQIAKYICDYFTKLKKFNFDYRKLIKFVNDRKGHDLRYAIDSSKIKKNLSWKPKIEFKKGLDLTIKHYIKEFNNN